MKKKDDDVCDVEFIRADRDMVFKRDEKAALMVYRFVKTYISQIVCLVLGFLLGVGVFK